MIKLIQVFQRLKYKKLEQEISNKKKIIIHLITLTKEKIKKILNKHKIKINLIDINKQYNKVLKNHGMIQLFHNLHNKKLSKKFLNK